MDTYSINRVAEAMIQEVNLTQLEDKLQGDIDSIWRYISLADSIGHDKLSAQCGNSVEDVLTTARSLARILTTTRTALISATATLQCARISAIYIEAIHGSFCTDSAEAVAWAFVLFSIAAFCMMIMVSLRAAMYNQVEDVEVYGDHEVAENMVLNEYEEYLAYISKYKHEWEEYRGITTNNMENSQCSKEDSASVRSDDLSWTERGDDDSRSDTDLEDENWPVDGDDIDESDSEHDYGSIDSTPTDDISFPSLLGSHSMEGDDDPLAMPSYLLPGAVDASDQEPVFFASPDGNSEYDYGSPRSSQTSNISFPSMMAGSPVHLMEEDDPLDIPTMLGVQVMATRRPVVASTPNGESDVEVQLMAKSVAMASILDDKDVHRSLYYADSPLSEQRDDNAPWTPFFDEDTTEQRQVRAKQTSLLRSPPLQEELATHLLTFWMVSNTTRVTSSRRQLRAAYRRHRQNLSW